MTDPLLPDYGRSTVSELLPSISAALGQPELDNVLQLPTSDRYVVVLVDGLGWDALEHADAVAPHLAALTSRAIPITAGVPSTTSTSVTSLGTGLPPGQHGMAGYSFRYRPMRGILNALAWAPGVSGLDVQPQLTVFERLARAGVQVGAVVPDHFRGSGLSTAALRGASFLGVLDEADVARRVELTRQAALAGDRSLVYVYERSLDHAGHSKGSGSPEWLSSLAFIDRLVAALRSSLPADVRLVVTADHGMVNVPYEGRVTVENEPELLAGVDLLGGEARLRHLYVRPGQSAAVRDRWADRLGVEAWVRTLDEAVDEGWFGSMSPRLRDRFGDVLVAVSGATAIMTKAQPNELTLIGMHGSLTRSEMQVPLFVL